MVQIPCMSQSAIYNITRTFWDCFWSGWCITWPLGSPTHSWHMNHWVTSDHRANGEWLVWGGRGRFRLVVFMNGQIFDHRESSTTLACSSRHLAAFLKSNSSSSFSPHTHSQYFNQAFWASLLPVSLHCEAHLCPKNCLFSSLTRSTPPDPRWVLYLPSRALALCPLLTPISQPLSP